MKRIFAVFQVLLFLISSLAVSDSNFKFLVDRAAIDLTGTTQVEFGPIDANQAAVSQEEKDKCISWYNENVLGTDKPAYNFTAGGKSLRDNLDDWSIAVGEEGEVGEVYRGGKTTYITLTHNNSGLVATVEATLYEDYATCEWTVFITNTAGEDSPVIKDFYAADCVLPTGKTDVYMNKGSEPAAEDFQLMKSGLGIIPMRFSANGGRTESFLPYFNLHGTEASATLAVGWSGQWFVSLAQAVDGVRVKAKQETFNAYLESDETVRSPLVTLTFYSGENALKGFNCFRDFTVDCVYPEGTKPIITSGVGVEWPESTIDSLVANINSIPDWFAEEVDYYWIDAGWYPIRTNWGDSVGNWFVDPKKFDRGFAEVSAAAHEKGIGIILWHEPERCSTDTEVYNECKKHDGWLVEQDEERNLVNIGIDECLEYITGIMQRSIKENGVDYLRIDSIPEPGPFWDKAETARNDGRKGITENHYVANLYRMLDTLMENNPGLLIDNCCSGGKRLDIEMSRRSIPLWRSDYNCMDGEGKSKPDILQATQSQTYGISFWLPYNGTCAYIEGEYADRTNIICCSQKLGYKDIKALMVGNYYPLANGGLDTGKYLAMQFDNGAKEGTALIYKREDVENSSYTLKLNGLEPDTIYEVYDYDKPGTVYEMSGSELMLQGIELTINETPKAVIVMYNVK